MSLQVCVLQANGLSPVPLATGLKDPLKTVPGPIIPVADA